MKIKRVTLFLGHYGSGKTNVAVNYALWLKNQGLPVAIYDMDVVNPYYRTADAKEILEKAGVRLVVGTYANSNVEVPALPAENYGIIAKTDEYAVVDVGGDDRGALALGRYVDMIVEQNNYQALLVVNRSRPETRTVEDALEIKSEIETACHMKMTGIVNNTNLGGQTTLQTLLDSKTYVEGICKKTGLELEFTAVHDILSEDAQKHFENILPLTLIKYGDWVY